MSSRCLAGRKLEDKSETAWDALKQHHAGEWFGEWTETGPSGLTLSTSQAITAVAFGDNGETCTIYRMTYVEGEPTGESRGGTVARGQLTNHMLGPMYQGSVVAGSRVVFEAGMSFESETRVRIAVEYSRGEAAAGAVPHFSKLTVIREQLGGFPNAREPHLFSNLDASKVTPATYAGKQYVDGANVPGGECDAEVLVDDESLSTWGFGWEGEQAWRPIPHTGPAPSEEQQIIQLPGRMTVSIPQRLVVDRDACIRVKWFPSLTRLFASECHFVGPTPSAQAIPLEVRFFDLQRRS